MCLIVLKPKNIDNSFTFDMFKNAAEINSDSVGIMFLKNGKLKVKKYLHPLKHLRSIYNKIKDKSQYAIHFRYATHGVLNLSNAHPFEVVPGLWMMHNGILSAYGKTNSEWSDTKDFVINYVRPIIKEKGIGILNDKDFQNQLSKEIGSGNKLLFIDKDFNATIINADMGVWYNGLWLSNSRTLGTDYIDNSWCKLYLNAKDKKLKQSYYDMPDNCDEYGIPYFDDFCDYYDNKVANDYWDTYR